MGRVKHPGRKVLILAVAAAVLALWQRLEIPCVMRSITGLICPGCGMTRAWLAMLRLQVAEAFSWHPMFWAVPVFGLYWFFDGQLLGRPKADRIVLWAVVTSFAVCYLLRLAAFCAGSLTL